MRTNERTHSKKKHVGVEIFVNVTVRLALCTDDERSETKLWWRQMIQLSYEW
jgi:hypothetical protein